jgi:hypothetical protein
MTFKEYYQGDKSMSSTVMSLTDPGGNGKSLMRTGRKHENLKRQEYKHKCPHVDNLINGSAQQIKLTGQPLINTLSEYGVKFCAGQNKGLGNSGVAVKMYEDEEHNACGVLTKK